MKNLSNRNEVKNLCSRKLLELLKNGEWTSSGEKAAIESELLARQHYVEQLLSLKDQGRILAPSNQTRH